MHVFDRTIIPGTFQQTRCCNGTWQRRLYIHMLGSLAFCCHWIVYPWCTHDLPVAQDWGFVQRLDLETDGPIITAKTCVPNGCCRQLGSESGSTCNPGASKQQHQKPARTVDEQDQLSN